MWFIGVEVEQETSAPPPEKNPGPPFPRRVVELRFGQCKTQTVDCGLQTADQG